MLLPRQFIAAFCGVLVCLASVGVAFSLETPYNRKLLQSSWQPAFPWFSTPSPFSPSSQQTTVGSVTAVELNDAECPTISLELNSIEVYDDIINEPLGAIIVQCYTKGGKEFAPITFSTMSETVRGASGARYKPAESAAQITCGDTVSCRVMSSKTSLVDDIEILADEGCWFDFRHFTQLSYKEPLSAWTCNKPPVRYTLACIECSDPSFPWAAALALGGPPLSESEATGISTTFNSVMVIVSVSVVSVAVVLAVTGVLVRSRRRSAAIDRQMTELIRRESLGENNGARRRSSRSFKPPDLFVVGEPSDKAPPVGYTGPIVVLHCGEGEGEAESSCIEGTEGGAEGSTGVKDETQMLRWPSIAIARAEVSTSLVVDEEEQKVEDENVDEATTPASASVGVSVDVSQNARSSSFSSLPAP